MMHWIDTHFWTSIGIILLIAFTLAELWWMLFAYVICSGPMGLVGGRDSGDGT